MSELNRIVDLLREQGAKSLAEISLSLGIPYGDVASDIYYLKTELLLVRESLTDPRKYEATT